MKGFESTTLINDTNGKAYSEFSIRIDITY